MPPRPTWRRQGGRGRGIRSATGSAAASGMVGVGEPQRRARRSRKGGFRGVEGNLVGVTASTATSAARVAVGPLIKSDKIVN